MKSYFATMKSHRKFSFWVFSALVLSFIFFVYIHAAFDYLSCPLCDGNFYFNFYQYSISNTIEIPKSPYHSRFLIPILAASFPFKLKTSFLIIHLAFGAGAVVFLLKLWKSFKINLNLQAIGFFWLFFHWIGIFSHNVWDYIAVDSAVICVHAMLGCILITKKYLWTYLLCFLGLLIKESIVPLMIGSFFIEIWIGNVNPKQNYHLLLAGVIGLFFLVLLQNYLNPEAVSSVRIMLFHLRELIIEPSIVLRWSLAVFWAYGLLVWFLDGKGIWFWLSVFYAGLGLVGGRDATRILFLGFPFAMTAILLAAQKANFWFLAISFVLSLPFLRFFAPFPTRYGKDYLNFFPESASGLHLFYFCVCPIITTYLLWLLKKHGNKRLMNAKNQS